MYRTALARRALVAHRATTAFKPTPMSSRMYSDGRTEGKVASSQGFGKREKAQEDIFIREQEKAKLAKLREQMQKQREELAALEAEHDELATKVSEPEKK